MMVGEGGAREQWSMVHSGFRISQCILGNEITKLRHKPLLCRFELPLPRLTKLAINNINLSEVPGDVIAASVRTPR
jgi:hypothetical protein